MKEEDVKKIERVQKILSSENKFSPDQYVHGGCYIYAKILNAVIENSTVYLSKDFEHCVLKIDNKLYDAKGAVPKTDMPFYQPLKDSDNIYCLNNYGQRKRDNSFNQIVSAILTYMDLYGDDKEIQTKLYDFIRYYG